MQPDVINRLNKAGVTNLVTQSRRGDFTLPADLVGAYDDLQALVAARPRVDQRDLDEACVKVMRAFSSRHEALLVDHIRPAFTEKLAAFAADVDTLGAYAYEFQPSTNLLREPAKVQKAYLRFTESNIWYSNMRAAWRCVFRPDHDCPDPHGTDSLFTAIANLGDILPDWQAMSTGNKPWPWAWPDQRVRLAWLVRNGAELVLPTRAEHVAIYRKHNPEPVRPRGAAA